MRARTLILVFFAILLAGATAFLARQLPGEKGPRNRSGRPGRDRRKVALPAPAVGARRACRHQARGRSCGPRTPAGRSGRKARSTAIISCWAARPSRPAARNRLPAPSPATRSPPASRSPDPPRVIAPGTRGFLAAVLRPEDARDLGPGQHHLGDFRLYLSRRPGRPDAGLYDPGGTFGGDPARGARTFEHKVDRNRAAQHPGRRHRSADGEQTGEGNHRTPRPSK